MQELFKAAVERGASDIHIKAGDFICARIHGDLQPLTATIRDCIKDPDRIDDISDLIAESRDHYGSQTFDQHLMDLVHTDVIEFELAMAAANNPADFDLKMRMFNEPGATNPQGKPPADMTQMYGGE